MHMQWFNLALACLKGIENKPGERSNGLIRMNDVQGVEKHKLVPHFGEGAELWKVPVSRNMYGNIVLNGGEPLPFRREQITAAWAEPTNRRMYCLLVPGIVGNYTLNMLGLGFGINPGPKLFKRLKRLFSVAALASTSEFSHSIIRDPRLAPEKLTDGMAFARTGFIRHLLRDKRIEEGRVFQYSYVGAAGMAKGNIVTRDDLTSDIVIPGAHNIKEEVKKLHGQHFCIENVMRAGNIRTDLQSMLNMLGPAEFEKSITKEMQRLAELACNGEAAQKYMEEEFDSVDWYRKTIHEDIESKEQKPPLTQIRELGINVNVSPALRRLVFGYEAKRVDIHGLRVPIVKNGNNLMATRAYAMPQLNQFDRDGQFKPNPATVMEWYEIAMPHLREGPIVVFRQPNGPGEFATYVNRFTKSKVACELSPLAIDPELASVYGKQGASESVLKVHGGMDMDDPLCGIASDEAIAGAMYTMRELAENNVPRVNMEAIIDAAVQSGAKKFDFWSQAAAATQKEIMGLGEAVNFIMALVALKKWDWLKKVAKAQNPEELLMLQFQYLKQDGEFPDLWMPERMDSWDPDGRIPVKEWGYGDEPFAYEAVKPVATKFGELAVKYGNLLHDIHLNVRESLDINSDTWITQPAGLDWLRGIVADLDCMRVAAVLDWLWSTMSGFEQELQVSKEVEEILFSVPIPEPDAPYREKCNAWSIVAWKFLKGMDLEQRLQVTAALALAQLEPRWRTERMSGKRMRAPGHDALLWNSPREEDGNLAIGPDGNIAIGIRECWVMILSEYTNSHTGLQV